MENFSLTHLSLVNSKKDILEDIPRDMYPFSVFGLAVKLTPISRFFGSLTNNNSGKKCEVCSR